jgi:hypothetical protein
MLSIDHATFSNSSFTFGSTRKKNLMYSTIQLDEFPTSWDYSATISITILSVFQVDIKDLLYYCYPDAAVTKHRKMGFIDFFF